MLQIFFFVTKMAIGPKRLEKTLALRVGPPDMIH